MNVYLDYQAIGYRVLVARKRAGIKRQEDLAKKVGTTKEMISSIENGYPAAKDDMYKKIAEVLGVSVEYLMIGYDTASTNLVAELLIYLSTIYSNPDRKLDDIINDLTRILNRFKIKRK